MLLAVAPTFAESATHTCEACGMEVTADDELHFQITDGLGETHFVECYMCALNLIKRYDTLHIQAFCDWYGPNYAITVDSTGYGAHVTFSPTTAMYLYAGSCENNRAAYNQSAAEALETGYSEYTSLLQQHDWGGTPTVITLAEAKVMYNPSAKIDNSETAYPFLMPALVTVGSFAIVGASMIGYRKFRRK
jgi:hypothetical protein